MSEFPLASVVHHWRGTIGEVISWDVAHHKHTVFLITTSDGHRFVVKQLHERPTPERMAAEYDLLKYLSQHGVPVSVPLLADDQRSYVEVDGGICTISPALPMVASPEGNMQERYRNIGRAIGHLHGVLDAYPHAIPSWTMDLPQMLESEVFPLLEHDLGSDDAAALRQKIAPIKTAMYDLLAQLPIQRIHGDCHGGNVLLNGDEVSGFIDLDHLPMGPRVYDLSYFLADQVKNQIYNPDELTDWLRTFRYLIMGYVQEFALTASEKQALWYGMLVTQLLFTYWFVKYHNEEHIRKNLDVFDWIYAHRQEIASQIIEADRVT